MEITAATIMPHVPVTTPNATTDYGEMSPASTNMPIYYMILDPPRTL